MSETNSFGESLIDVLNDMHHDLVGETIDKTDFDKIIGVLKVIADKIIDLEDHTHILR